MLSIGQLVERFLSSLDHNPLLSSQGWRQFVCQFRFQFVHPILLFPS